METKTKVYLAKQAAMLCASLLIILLSAYVEGHGQNTQSGTQNIVLSIQGSGTIIVSGYPNPIVGPVNNSLAGPFASGSLLSLTAYPVDGWSFIGWVGPVLELPEANPNTLIILDDDIHLTAIFRRIITLSEFQADDKVYDGTTLASVSSWGNLQGRKY